MKKTITTLVSITSIMAVMLSAQSSTMSANDITVEVNGTAIDFSSYDNVMPYIENDYTLIPIRAVSESLGLEVDWNSEARTVSVKSGSTDIVFVIDSDNAIINGNTVQLDIPARITDERTFVPLRFVSENMGASVAWDGEKRLISISTNSPYVSGVTDPTHPVSAPYIEQLFKSTDNNVRNFEKNVDINGHSYHIISNEVSGKDMYDYGKEYVITINGATIKYSTERFCMRDAYIADLNASDDSVEIFITSVWDNDYTDLTAYRYTDGIIEQLYFGFDDTEEKQTKANLGMRYYGLSLKNNDIALSTSTHGTYGCWGIKQYIYDAGNNTLNFRHQDKYEVLSFTEQEYTLKEYDYNKKEWVPLTCEYAVNHIFGVSSEEDYNMFIKGYVRCGMSYGGINEGEYFKLLYDYGNGTVTYQTYDGREGQMEVNSLRDNKTRTEIGGIILMMVA